MLCKGSVNATSSESFILQSTLVIAKVPREVSDVMMYNRLLSKTLKYNRALQLIIPIVYDRNQKK